MSTFALDENYNYLSDEELLVFEGCDEVAQNVRVCLSLFPGESLVFPDAGLDFTSPLLRDERFAPQIIQAKISNIDGVDFVSAPILLSGDNRDNRYTFNVTIDGDIIELGI